MIRKWEPDKWKHFYVGIVTGIVLQFAGNYFFSSQPAFSFFICFISLLLICYGFELVSLITGKGHYELMDAIAGIIGGTIGMGIIWLANFIIV